MLNDMCMYKISRITNLRNTNAAPRLYFDFNEIRRRDNYMTPYADFKVDSEVSVYMSVFRTPARDSLSERLFYNRRPQSTTYISTKNNVVAFARRKAPFIGIKIPMHDCGPCKHDSKLSHLNNNRAITAISWFLTKKVLSERERTESSKILYFLRCKL